MLTPKVKIESAGDVRVLRLRGEFVGGNETDTLRDTFAKESEAGTGRLLIDLKDVTYMNSTALGALIAGHASFTKRGAQLGLSNASDNIKNIFVITKLAQVFNMFETTEEGVKKLSEG